MDSETRMRGVEGSAVIPQNENMTNVGVWIGRMHYVRGHETDKFYADSEACSLLKLKNVTFAGPPSILNSDYSILSFNTCPHLWLTSYCFHIWGSSIVVGGKFILQ